MEVHASDLHGSIAERDEKRFDLRKILAVRSS
jgi:hypothetical protein